ncbi:MAG: DUF5667 domain-containing protein [Nanoarchaeota archaeon]|nr:DUF5667 domain-containing protein [Nanoarchaeota archaeon]
MKKISALFLGLFLLVGMLGFVVAVEDSSGEIVIPEAREVGFFEDVFDRVGFAFIFNKERKIERALELAEKRLAEAEAFAEEDPEKAEKAQERYDNFVAKAEEILEKIEAQKSNDEAHSVKDMEEIARIQNRFEKHREQAEEIHIRAIERFRNNNASEEKIERFENFYERALNRSDNMEQKVLQKRERVLNQYKVLSGKSDEELKVILGGIESKEGLVKAREMRLERVESRNARVVAVHELGLEKVRTRLENSGLSDEQRVKVQAELGKLNQKLGTFKEQSIERIEVAKGKFDEVEVLDSISSVAN